MSKTISEEEAFVELEAMFPGYERKVLSDFLESNNGNLSKTIEQLLQINAEETSEVKKPASSAQDRKSVGSNSTASTGHGKNEGVEEDFRSAFEQENESPLSEKKKSSEQENPKEGLKTNLIYDEMLAATLQQQEVKQMDDEMVIDQAIRNSLISIDSDEVSRVKDFEKRAHLFFKKVHMGFDQYGHEVLHDEIISIPEQSGLVCYMSPKLEKYKKRKSVKLR